MGNCLSSHDGKAPTRVGWLGGGKTRHVPTTICPATVGSHNAPLSGFMRADTGHALRWISPTMAAVLLTGLGQAAAQGETHKATNRRSCVLNLQQSWDDPHHAVSTARPSTEPMASAYSSAWAMPSAWRYALCAQDMSPQACCSRWLCVPSQQPRLKSLPTFAPQIPCKVARVLT